MRGMYTLFMDFSQNRSRNFDRAALGFPHLSYGTHQIRQTYPPTSPQ